MKILVVAPSKVYGGGEMFVETLDAALRTCEVHFIVNNKRLEKNLSVRKNVVNIHKDSQIISFLHLIFTIWKMFFRHRYELILLNGFPEIGIFGRYLPRTELVCVGHSEERWCLQNVSLKKPLHAVKRIVGYKCSKFLSAFICITKVTRENVCSRYELKDKCVVIYPSIKPFVCDTEFSDRGKGMPLVVGRIGRLTAGKGNEDLLLAFSIARQNGLNMQLLFAGSGEDQSKLETLAANLGVSDVVEFAGFMSREDFFARTDVCVSPSYHEGFPIVLLEAMFANTCIISSDVGGVSEMLNEECAILYKAGDIEQLHKALEVVANSPQIRLQLSDCAFSKFEENFSPDKFELKLRDTLNVC